MARPPPIRAQASRSGIRRFPRTQSDRRQKSYYDSHSAAARNRNFVRTASVGEIDQSVLDEQPAKAGSDEGRNEEDQNEDSHQIAFVRADWRDCRYHRAVAANPSSRVMGGTHSSNRRARPESITSESKSLLTISCFEASLAAKRIKGSGAGKSLRGRDRNCAKRVINSRVEISSESFTRKALSGRLRMVDASHQEIGEIIDADHAAAVRSFGPGQRHREIDKLDEPQKISSNSGTIDERWANNDDLEPGLCRNGTKRLFRLPFRNRIWIFGIGRRVLAQWISGG